MKQALLGILLLAIPSSVVGQSVCQQVTSQLIQHKLGFTIRSVTLRSAHSFVRATASMPDDSKPSRAVVFTFSTLVDSESQDSVDMTPFAIELTQKGWSTIVIERKLTWPDVDQSVGTMRPDVLCAEQWLSKHATVTPSDWIFVGPDSDAPDPAVGYKPGMTGWLGFIVGDKPGDPSTERLFHGTSEIRNFIFSQHFLNN